MNEWTPTTNDLGALREREHKLRLMLLVADCRCGGCGRKGFLRVVSTVGLRRRVVCGCGWRGKLIDPEA